MKKQRPRKPDDNDNINKAIDLIFELMSLNKIESTLWSSACVFVLANGYSQSKVSFKDFKEDMNNAFDHYKGIFDEK